MIADKHIIETLVVTILIIDRISLFILILSEISKHTFLRYLIELPQQPQASNIFRKAGKLI